MTTLANDTPSAPPRGLRPTLIRLIEVSRITPNTVTVIGFLGTIAAAGLIVAEAWIAAGFLFTAAALVDSLDGALARLQGTSSRFGAFLDSVLDRVSDGATLGAFAIVFAGREQPGMVAVVLVAVVASQVISYARARADGLGVRGPDGGLMGRTERLVLLGPAIVMGDLSPVTEIIIIALAALTVWTVIERMLLVRRSLQSPNPGNKGELL